MSRDPTSLSRRLVAEVVGSALLLAAIVGSGVMGERLAGGNVAIALLANSMATGAALAVLILTFAPISGAHFNPAVTLVLASRRITPCREVGPYIAVQFAGALLGTATAHAMFGLPLLSVSGHARAGPAQFLAELVATFGLVAVVWGTARRRPETAAFAIAGYIASAYWFTSSTSFANPAVTLARTLSDTFVGIRPVDAPAFVLAQLLGAAAATMLFRWFYPSPPVALLDEEAGEDQQPTVAAGRQ